MTDPLDNSRHEIFAQNIAKGMNGSEAYREAGYTGDGVGQSASRLLTNAKVIARVEFIKQSAAEVAIYSIAYLHDRMDSLSRTAEMEDDMPSAIVAHRELCKMRGAYEEKKPGSDKDTGGAIRDRLGAMTYEQVMKLGTGNK